MIYMQIETRFSDKCRSFLPSLAAATKEAVEDWHTDVFPGHFKRGAARKYKYKPRTKNYQKQKRKEGSPPALVLSGYSRRMLTMNMKVTGKKGVTRGKFKSSSFMRYFWMVPKKHPNKPQEMKVLTANEVENMNRYIKARTVDKIEAIQKRRQVR